MRRSLEAVYTTLLPKGGHPWIYVSLDIDPAKVDVNVHPTKKEVHFLDQDEIVEQICNHVQELLADANSSRTFHFTQALLPGAAPPPSASETLQTQSGPSSLQRGYPKHTVRVDANSRTLDSMLTSKRPGSPDASAESEGARTEVPAAKRPARLTIPESSCALTSIGELRAAVQKERHRSLTEAMRSHTFVGVIDMARSLSLVQHETKLFMLNHAAFIEECAYQLVLRQFGAIPRVSLDPPPSLHELVRLGLEAEPDVDLEGSDRDTIASVSPDKSTPLAHTHTLNRVQNTVALLCDHAEMLSEYFSLCIDAEARTLTALPALVPPDVTLPLERVPLLLARLGPMVDWDDEKACFETFARELAFAAIPTTREHVQHTWFPALRLFAPPRRLVTRDVVQLASLPDLCKLPAPHDAPVSAGQLRWN